MGALAARRRRPSDGGSPCPTRRYRFPERSRSAGTSGPVPVDEGLDDRLPLAFLGEDGPRDEVEEETEPVDEGEHPEQEPDEVDVDVEVGSESRADPGDHPSLL